MKILFLSNNEISHDLFLWLKQEQNEDIDFFSEKLDVETIEKYAPEFIISYNYRFIIREEVLNRFSSNNAINLHISYLPWNKGTDPNVWSFLENTPKGVTIHLLDKGIDTGDILLQKKIDINEELETLASSYKMLHKEIKRLFKNNWMKLKNNKIAPKPQSFEGTFHYKNDFEKISYILGNECWDLPIIELKKRFKKIMKKQDVY